MRVGPSRLTSTAASSGESKLTVAAEWIDGVAAWPGLCRPSSSRPSPSVPTSPAIDLHPPGDQLVELGLAADLGAQPVEAVVAEDLPLGPLLDACASRPGRTSRTISQSGTERSRRSTSAVPRNPVAPVMAMRLPAKAPSIESVDELIDSSDTAAP